MAEITLHGVLDREGVDSHPAPRTKPEQLTNLARRVFKEVPQEGDPRWRLTYKLARLEKLGLVRDRSTHFATQAVYLSSHASRKGRPVSLEQITHAARVLANIEIGENFQNILGNASLGLNGYSTKFLKTRSVSMEKDKDGLRGLPEALWQMRMYREGACIGRIGFNFHIENGQTVVSITNIQGVDGRLNEIKNAKSDLGYDFGVGLIGLLKTSLPEKVVFRGIRAPKSNFPLYRMTFRKSGIRILR